MKEPSTPEEWQAALDTVVTLLEGNGADARTYGLATVNLDRCGEILRRAKALGYRPSAGAVKWVTTPGYGTWARPSTEGLPGSH